MGKSTELESNKPASEIKADRQSQNPVWGPEAIKIRKEATREHQSRFASLRHYWIENNRFYYDSIKSLLRFVIEPGKRVLNIRSETGHLLDAVAPSFGIGVELSSEMVNAAKIQYPQWHFIEAYPEEFNTSERFDYIIFNNINDTADVLKALKQLRGFCESHTRLVIYTINHLWQPVFNLAERCKLKMPLLEQNWLSAKDLQGLFLLSGFDWLQSHPAIILPKQIPFLSNFFNRFIILLPWLRNLSMVNIIVARPTPLPLDPAEVTVSVIVPCKNERENIELAVQRIPELGKGTEIIFCDDKSEDGTYEEILRVKKKYTNRNIKLVQGPGICKAENVWTGFNAAKGDMLMILDADLTVMPEELPYFFDALSSGKGDFINGVRLVYPLPKMAMKYANLVGNKVFSLIFSYILGQPIKDTLCGTKVLWRRDWERIKPLVGSWGINDRWGDFDLIFGAAKLHLRILDLPIHYQERVFGETKMVRVFYNGIIMLRMCLSAFIKLGMRL